jgi:fructose-bisphosphate aldolase class II
MQMPIARTADLVAAAHRAGSGLLAFNVITLEHAEGILAGAERTGKSVILQISENAVKFHHGRLGPIVAAAGAVATTATVDVAVHLDHVEDEALLHACAGTAATSAMFDASKLDYDANVAATKDAAQWAHSNGLFLEAELGEVGGKDGAHAPGVRTDPDEAAAFVAATGVDALAVAVGSSHAMTERTAALDHALIGRLRDAVPVPLVLHGSSGVPDDEIRQAVASSGMVKINVGTALNTAFTGAVRAHLAEHTTGVDPRKYIAPGREAMAATVAGFLALMG